MFNLYYIKYSIDYLDERSIIKSYNIQDLRQHVRILLIDDEKFILEEPLKRAGFNITYKKDIEVFRDVEPYQIILCDIRGVGKSFGSDKEGAYLIKEVKRLYPTIQVIAYTGSSYDPTYNCYVQLADDFIPKGSPIDDWTSRLDEQIMIAVDPRKQWHRIRTYLLDEGIKTTVVAQIESKYVEGIITKSLKTLEDLAIGFDENVTNSLSNILTNSLIKLLVGGIINVITTKI